MATIKEVIELLSNDAVVQAVPKLRNAVKKLESAHKRSEKISDRNCTIISLMADGVDYDEACRLAEKK